MVSVNSKYRYLRDDFQLTTWIAFGAALQISLSSVLPTRVALLPAVLLLLYRVSVFAATKNGFIRDTTMERVHVGRYTAQIPRPDSSFSSKPSDQEVTVFILGAQWNRYAPDIHFFT
jgi:hypothetical protein